MPSKELRNVTDNYLSMFGLTKWKNGKIQWTKLLSIVNYTGGMPTRDLLRKN